MKITLFDLLVAITLTAIITSSMVNEQHADEPIKETRFDGRIQYRIEYIGYSTSMKWKNANGFRMTDSQIVIRHGDGERFIQRDQVRYFDWEPFEATHR